MFGLIKHYIHMKKYFDYDVRKGKWDLRQPQWCSKPGWETEKIMKEDKGGCYVWGMKIVLRGFPAKEFCNEGCKFCR